MSQIQWVGIRPSEAQRRSESVDVQNLIRENKALREALKASQEQLNLIRTAKAIRQRNSILKYENYRKRNPSGWTAFKARMQRFISLFIVREPDKNSPRYIF